MKSKYPKFDKKILPAKIDSAEKVLVFYSDDKEYYYLPEYANPHSFWLSKATGGEVPADQKNNSGLFKPTFIQIKTNTKPPKVYHRKLLRFSFWAVLTENKFFDYLNMNDDSVLDYFAYLDKDNRL